MKVMRAAWVAAALFGITVTAEAKLTVTGTPADKATWDKLVAQCTKASPSLKMVFDKINNTPGKDVKVDLVRNKKKVYVDSFCTNEVDLSDLEDYPALDPAKVIDRCELLAHFMAERLHAVCNPMQPGETKADWFRRAHQEGIDAENRYRMDIGYTDKICQHTAAPGGKKVCHLWKDNTKTYDAIAEERSETGYVGSNALTVPGKMVLTVDTTQNNYDVIDLPEYAGGGQRVVAGYNGSIAIDIEPFEAPNHALIRVTSIELEAPAITLAVVPMPHELNPRDSDDMMTVPISTSTGVNRVTLDPAGWQFGVINLKTNQVWVSYTGKIVNDLYPESDPMPIFSTVTGIWNPRNNTIHLHTAAAFLDGVPGDTDLHWLGSDIGR